MLQMTKRSVVAAMILGAVACFAQNAASAADLRAPVRDREHNVQMRVRSWQELQRRNVVMQRRDYSCGAAALATLLRYYWNDPVSEEDILQVLDKLLTVEETKDRIKNGLAISDLRRAAVKMGYLSTIGTMSFEKLTESRVPLVVPIKVNKIDHFVVYRGTFDGYVYLADPGRGNVRTPVHEFRQQWNDNAVLVAVKPGVTPPTQSALTVRQKDVSLGETNWQLIRTEPPLQYVNPMNGRIP